MATSLLGPALARANITQYWDNPPTYAQDTTQSKLDIGDAWVGHSGSYLLHYVGLWGSVPQSTLAGNGPGLPAGVCAGGIDTNYSRPGPEYFVCTDPSSPTGATVGPNAPDIAGGGPAYVTLRQETFFPACCLHGPYTETQVIFQFSPATIGSPRSYRWKATAIYNDTGPCKPPPGQDTDIQGCRDDAPNGTVDTPGAPYVYHDLFAPFSHKTTMQAEEPPPPPDIEPDPVFQTDFEGPQVKLAGKAKVKGGKASFKASCPASEKIACFDTTLESKSFAADSDPTFIEPGQKRTIRVKLSKQSRGGRGSRVTVTVISGDEIGNVSTRKAKVKLRS
ncbi:MAG TPA: hypothetical protein VEK39_11700 [Solirubrobacterales bacterium]|nr:hypothetical protein [Solirubrobacterales bacterium]